jgi:hypothetical protein
VKVSKTAQINQDNLMTNTFGNTVNVRVPSVGGIYVAPPTGNTTAVGLLLSLFTVAAYFGWRNKNLLLSYLKKI